MEELIGLKDPRVAQAFNTWMRRLIEHPEQYGREWQIVAEFLEQEQEGIEPTYGDVCVAYLQKLIAEG